MKCLFKKNRCGWARRESFVAICLTPLAPLSSWLGGSLEASRAGTAAGVKPVAWQSRKNRVHLMPLKSSPAKKGSLFDLSSTFIKRPCFLSPNSELGLCGQSSPWVNFLTAWHLQTLRPTGTSEKLTKKHKKEKWGRPHTRVGVCLGLVLCPCSRDRPTALFTCWPHPSSGLGFYG